MKKIKLENKTPSLGGRFIHLGDALGARSRIFICFLIYTVIMILVIWLFQIVFLQDIYEAQTKRSMSGVSRSIANNIDNENIQSLIERFAERNNICITVMDENLFEVNRAEGLFNCVLHRLSPHDLKRFTEASSEDGDLAFYTFPMAAFRNLRYDNKKFIGSVPPVDAGGATSIISVQRVPGKEGKNRYILINAMMTPLEGTVSTLRSELVLITVILLFFSFIVSWLLSKQITNPIVAVTKASAQLKDRKYIPVEHPGYKEVKQLNECLAEAAKELSQVEEMQRELIANISHDLRTPLTLMQGYAEMIRDIPGENTPENIQVILDEAKRLSTLVEAAISLNCLQKGRVESEVSCFSGDEVVESLTERYNKLLEKDGLRVVYEHEEEAWLRTDKLQFEQVLQNLINNALTYTGSDKTVYIRQKLLEHTVRYNIIDSGEGITSEELIHIWERYYRSGKPHKRATVGSGLGLNIVKKILDAGGLKYGVESQPGEGSNFWFEVKRDEGAE